jgi:hypothetical protein
MNNQPPTQRKQQQQQQHSSTLPDLVLVLGLVSPGAACRLRESGRSSFCIIAIMKS